MAGSPAVASHPEDALLTIHIAAATQWAENYMRRSLITQTLTMRMDGFPSAGAIELPRLKLQSVTSVKYIDEDGVQQTWSDALYTVDIYSSPGRIQPIDGEAYPATEARLNAVEIEYVAGYGDAATDIDQSIKYALLMLIGHMYQNREEVVTGTIAIKVPFAIEAMVDKLIDRTVTREDL